MRLLMYAITVTLVLSGCADLDSGVVGVESTESGFAPSRDPAFVSASMTMPAGFSSGFPRAVNSHGVVAGWAVDALGEPQAVVWQDGGMIVLAGLGGSTSGAEGINQRGDVVGYAETADGSIRAVLWRDGVPQDLGTLGGDVSFAHAINARGDVVGVSETAAGTLHAFVWSKGQMTDLGKLPGTEIGWAEDINDRGTIVGWSAGGSVSQRATLWSGGEVVDLGTLAFESAALAVNARGDIVGGSVPAFQTSSRAVMWDGGAIVDLGSLADAYSSANGINERGQVVGVTAAPGCAQCPFFWDDGVMVELPPEGNGREGSATAINNTGIVVGYTGVGSDEGIIATLWMPAAEGSDRAAIAGARAGAAQHPRAQTGERSPAPEWADRYCRARGAIADPHSALAAVAGC